MLYNTNIDIFRVKMLKYVNILESVTSDIFFQLSNAHQPIRQMMKNRRKVPNESIIIIYWDYW